MAKSKKPVQAPTSERKYPSGEEWRAIEGGAAGYDFAAAQDVLNRARKRISEIRMRDVELRVVDRRGKPVADAPVEVCQTEHSFPFGDQLWWLDRMYRFNQHETDRAKYMKLRHAEVLNAANALCYWTERPRNDGPKTEDLQGDNVTDGFAYCVDWAASQGLIVKGHPLFWSIDKCVPEWVKRYDYRKQMMFAEVRVRNLAARFKGRVKIWDAVNEPLWEPAFKNLPHRHWPHIEPIEDMAEYIEQVLRWVREEDPDACCLINDYGLEQDKQELVAKDGTEVTAALQRRRFLKLVAELRRRGSPPDALGMQAHTGGWLDHQTQWAVYDELSQAGLPLHVTEFWAHTRGLAEQGRWSEETIDRLQAEYVANYLTAAFGHAALEGFFFWGFGGVEWYEHSGHELRPVFHRVRDLLHKEWRTQVQTRTDKSGAVRFRGFFGQYALRHELSPGVRHGVPFRVDRQSAMPLTVAVSTGA